jgi:hypothetical protein
MKTKFESINVSREEYNLFKTLSSQDRLDYIFNLYASAAVGIDLSNFFSAIHTALDNTETSVKSTSIEPDETTKHYNRVDVMIDDEIIMVEANSLKAMRHVINRFMQSGYILQRDIEQEKMFRKDKMTRYMRIFYIVDQISGICFN